MEEKIKNNKNNLKNKMLVPETSLVLQWWRHHIPNAGDSGSIPGQGTRAHIPQLRPSIAKYINIKKKNASS